MYKQILSLIVLSIISSACTFTDNFPDWKEVKEYKAVNFELGKTSLADFIKIYPDAIPKEAGKSIKTINLSTKDTDFFKKVRVGFKEEKLDWIEFTFSQDLKIKDLIAVYGKPESINKKYNSLFDYYNYGLFNAATEKHTENIKNITLFSYIPEKKKNEEIKINSLDVFKKFKPGYTTENEIKENLKFKTPTDIITSGISTIYYFKVQDKNIPVQNASLSFENGLLNWINISVSNFPLDKALKIYGKDYQIKALNPKYDLYDFKNTVLTVDKKSKKVINIGVL